MTELQTSAKTRRWDPWPVSIVAFFCVAIAGFAAFIWFCSRHPADLVAVDYYEQELRYQGQIDRVRNALRDAPGARVTYDSAIKCIIVSVPPDPGGGPARGVVQLYRPSAVNLDRQVTLQPDAAGTQRIDAADLSPGLWKVRVSWSVGEQDYFMDRRIVVESGAS